LRQRIAWCVLPILALAAASCEKLPAAPPLPDVPPTASFFFNPVSPIYAGQTQVAFNASASRDSDGSIVSYLWSFGDGTNPVTTTQPGVAHVFVPNGARCLNVTYGVSLAVTDNGGAVTLVSLPVTVTELPAPGTLACFGQ
jgi:PKD repeat protein